MLCDNKLIDTLGNDFEIEVRVNVHCSCLINFDILFPLDHTR